ncbi:YfhO family protein [bacterium]|nr:YfhO family protein [bacterium]
MIEKLKSSLPYLGTILLFIAISIIYFNPVLESKELPTTDNLHAIGMSHELVEFEKETGQSSQWSNNMFGGMPAYQIKGDSSNNLFWYLNNFFRLGLPYTSVAILFLYLIGFYVFMLSLKVDKWLSVVAALAFAFGSYNFIIIIAGHVTKSYAIALMAPVIAGIVYTYNRNKWAGGLLTTIALGLEIAYNHVQITYYLALLVGLLVITKFVYALIEKKMAPFYKATGVLVLAAILAILPNITNLWTTYEYGKMSIRGKSDLSVKQGSKEHDGLDKDYALSWSYGKKETFTLLIPNVVGGASEAIANNPEALEGIDAQLKEFVQGQSQYWGGKVFTSGPVYAGAIVCFLFFIGIFFYKGPDKWWLIGGFVLSLFLAWGKNFMWFTDIMFYHFPLYNKFRTVEMALVVASFVMPTLGFLGLREIYNNPRLVKENTLKFFGAFALTGGVSLFFYLFGSSFLDFITPQEAEGMAKQAEQSPEMAAMVNQAVEGLKTARINLMQADAIRSFGFILVASGSLWMYSMNKLGKTYLLGGLALLIIIDLWSVDKRYINNEDFASSRKAKQSFVESVADKAIKQDKSLGHRVFSIYRDPFTDAYTPYHHRSVGGFHGAKLRRYQDVISYYLESDWRTIMTSLQQQKDQQTLFAQIANMPALNMMNAKYIVYHPKAKPLFNPFAFGSAWFVKDINEVSTADEEIAGIRRANQTSAVINISEYPSLKSYSRDSVEGSIDLIEQVSNKSKYKVSIPADQLAVFSEVYYAKGWKAYIDGNEADIIRANYILRALMVPAGDHTIEFVFEPSSFKTGQILSAISSILILLLIVGFFVMKWRMKKLED